MRSTKNKVECIKWWFEDKYIMKKTSNNSKLYSVFTGSCPACHEGKMWSHHAYSLKYMLDMKKSCSFCNQNLEPEPSFYTGAMYVGYGFSVMIVFGVFIGFNILFKEPNINVMSCLTISIAVLFAPLNFRLSRSIWASLFIPFKEKNHA